MSAKRQYRQVTPVASASGEAVPRLHLPMFELRRGLDTRADPERLAEALDALPRHGLP